MHRLSPILLGLAGLFAVGQPAPAVAQQTPTFSAETGKTTQPILTGWRFHQAGQENWAPATVPGCVHTDLLATKQIEDPLYTQSAALQVEPLTSKVYLDIPKAKLLKSQDLRTVVLSCTLQAGGTTLSTNTHYFALPKEIALPKAAIAATWQPVSDSTYQVTLKSKALAREVNLSLAEGDGFFGNNYFDLLPGETKVLTFKSEGATSVDKLRKQLVVRTLADAF
jgi:hypothetical protein